MWVYNYGGQRVEEGTKPVRLVWSAFCFLLLLVWSLPSVAASEADLWAALRTPGHIAVMRHALAPGTGDPANFDIDDCATQRNLSDAGRRQAKRTGAAFRENGITEAVIFTSGWCRCRETAELLQLGTVSVLPALNSFFRNQERGAPQTRALREKIASMDLSKPVIMSTHQVNISALFNTWTNSGEIVVARRDAAGKLSVIGKITPRTTD